MLIELAHQWPNYRKRWWALLRKNEWSLLPLSNWPVDPMHQNIGDVIREWKAYGDEDEEQLALTEAEIRAYGDVRYGSDRRILNHQGKAATFLHSYGCALRGCPCGCRKFPFSEASLLGKGLRGCYVFSKRSGAPRFIHPEEMSILVGADPKAARTGTMREQLCLIGLIASPLQCLWVLGRLMIDYDKSQGHKPSFTLIELMAAYKKEILKDIRHEKREITIIQTCEKGESAIRQMNVSGRCTANDVVRAERIQIGWGERIGVIESMPNTDYGEEVSCIEIQQIQKRRKLQPPSREIVIYIYGGRTSQATKIFTGDFLFQCFPRLNISVDAKVLKKDGSLVSPDFRILFPASFCIVDPARFPGAGGGVLRGSGLRRADEVEEPATFAAQGITEVAIDREAMKIFVEAQKSFELWWSPKLILKIQEAWSILANAWVREKVGNENEAYGILWDSGHWVAFHAIWHNDHLQCIFYDGLRDEVSDDMHLFAVKLAKVREHGDVRIEVKKIISQSGGHHCGAIALMHLRYILGLQDNLNEQQAILWHRELVDDLGFMIRFEDESQYDFDISSTVEWQMIGSGPSAVQLKELAALLEEKGVPQSESQNRANAVIGKLGGSMVAHALRAENPWQVLKAAANAPSSRIRLVLAEEQKQFIEKRATSKFGAKIDNYKQKKQNAKQADLTLDPSLLMIEEEYFQDSEGKSVPVITFEEIAAGQKGVALANCYKAKNFIENSRSISPDALAILLVDLPPEDLLPSTKVKKLRYPAMYAGTREHILIFGGILNLGDKEVCRKMEKQGISADAIKTAVIKVQLARDQLQVPWQDINESAHQMSTQLLPALSFCEGKNCGTDCAKSHQILGEN